jgi:FMN-dependent NADH-azoreductase
MSGLFINACVRKESRTLALAKTLVQGLDDGVQQINLREKQLCPLDEDSLALRDSLIRSSTFSHPMLRYARQFAAADTIVIAAPYWELSFPALLKVYLEAVTVCGVAFHYQDGVPHGLCRARRLLYVTTAGGAIEKDFGFAYVQALAESFYGIKTVKCFRAESLDIDGAEVDAILQRTKDEINAWCDSIRTR